MFVLISQTVGPRILSVNRTLINGREYGEKRVDPQHSLFRVIFYV